MDPKELDLFGGQGCRINKKSQSEERVSTCNIVFFPPVYSFQRTSYTSVLFPEELLH